MTIENAACTVIKKACDNNGVVMAATLIKNGDVVALPTETVYGLGANALDPRAVEKIFAIKGRPQDNPLIVHVNSIPMWQELVKTIPEDALKLANAFWPGPLTIILKKSDKVPFSTTAGLDSVGVRMPNHEAFLEVISLSNTPIAAPSANISGSPSPTTAAHCADDLWGKVPLILDGGSCDVGVESTIISMVDKPVILRPGKITPDDIERVIGTKVYVSDAVTKPLKDNETPLSPGMKYRHYAPRAKVTIFEGSLDDFFTVLEESPEYTFGLVFDGEDTLTIRPCVTYGKKDDPASQAQGLFAALRTLDDQGALQIYARCPGYDDNTLAVYNRLLRAAAFEVKKL